MQVRKLKGLRSFISGMETVGRGCLREEYLTELIFCRGEFGEIGGFGMAGVWIRSNS
jgi:hypothetical protein